jgi:hypothetical protein
VSSTKCVGAEAATTVTPPALSNHEVAVRAFDNDCPRAVAEEPREAWTVADRVRAADGRIVARALVVGFIAARWRLSLSLSRKKCEGCARRRFLFLYKFEHGATLRSGYIAFTKSVD